MDASKMSRPERLKALLALMFLVKKRSGGIKVRKCTVGSKQRMFEGYKKEDGASPTVAPNRVLVTATIKAKEVCDVATMLDLPGAYLHTENDKHDVMLG